MKNTLRSPQIKLASLIGVLALVASLGMSQGAEALTATTNITVSASVTNTCTITASNISFGTYTTTTTLTATSTLSVTCSNGGAYSIALGDGLGTGASAATTRIMNGPSPSTLNYNIYTNPGWTNYWGATTGHIATGTGTGSAQTITAYGQVPSGQTGQLSGSYTDTIVATITF